MSQEYGVEPVAMTVEVNVSWTYRLTATSLIQASDSDPVPTVSSVLAKVSSSSMIRVSRT